MIDLKSNLEAIEQIMKLMETNQIEEISVDFLHIKKVRHTLTKMLPTDQELLKRHFDAGEQEPWNAIPDNILNEWAKGHK